MFRVKNVQTSTSFCLSTSRSALPHEYASALNWPTQMASQPPSIHSLQNWEDVFIHYPLPTVRALERDLRKNIDENRSKLRSLVGASYRDLLGTAERIIEMDGQMTTLERGLGDIGRRCDARMLERAGGNWAGMKKRAYDEEGEEGMAVMAQMKVLQGCLIVVGRVVKGRGDALLGAKVLVLARLLAKSIGESGRASAVLEELKKRLATLRKRLLVYIERSVTRADAGKAFLANTLCAHALVTSSTSKEVLRHFLQVRFRQLENMADSPGEDEVMRMLDIYSQTLLDTKDLFPRRFADAMSQLAKVPLLRDDQVQPSYEISLDIYGQWIAEDVRAFTPWVRHDPVASSEVNDALSSWTKQAHDCLLSGIEEYLDKQTDLSAIVESRHAIISSFMALSSRLRNSGHASAIDSIREAFLTRMKALAASSATLPELLLEDVVSENERKDSLWDLARQDVDLSSGAHSFRHAIVRRRHGRDAFIDSTIAKLDTWIQRVQSSLNSIEQARSRKWDDDLEFEIDDLDDGGVLLDALSKIDPEHMTQSLSEAIEATVASSFASIETGAESSKSPAHVLRIWRELDIRVRSLQARLAFSLPALSLQALHRNLALAISRQVIDGYLQSTKQVSHVASTLWDGTPALPVQPTPTTFKFLSALHRAMSQAGDDLWSVECVVELRRVVGERLDESLLESSGDYAGLTNGHTDGDGEIVAATESGDQLPEVPSSASKDALLQTLFDLLYLQQVFHVPQSNTSEVSGGLAKTIAQLEQRTEVDDLAFQRMEKSAKEYWKRTYLLFGLLASRAKD